MTDNQNQNNQVQPTLEERGRKIPPSQLTNRGGRQSQETEATKRRSNLLKRATPGGGGTAWSKQFYKRLGLDVLIIFSAAGVGYFYLRFLEGNISILWSLVVALIFALFANLGGMLGGGWKRRLVVSVLSAITLLVPFYGASLWATIAPSATALIVFSVWGDVSMHRRSKNMLKFAFFPLARIKIGKLVTGLTIVAVILYLPYWQGEIPFLSQDRFGRWYQKTAEFIRGPVVGEIEFSGSVEDFAKSIARRELQQNSNFQALPPDEKDRAIEAATTRLLESTEDRWNISLGADRQVSSVAYEYVINRITSLKAQLGDTFLAVWGIVIFFLVRSVGTVFSWVAMLASYLFYELFAAFGALRLTGENAVKEFVEFT